jgi:hypothetical protein
MELLYPQSKQTSYKQLRDQIANGLVAETSAPDARASGGHIDYWRHLQIQTKEDQIISLVPKSAQSHFLEHRTGRDLILKARQLGLSTIIQGSMFIEAVTNRVRCATLAHDDVSTALLRRMAERFWLGLDDSMRPARGLDNATTTTYPGTGSEVFIATAGSKNKGRAGTYSRVHGSEVAFWIDAASTMAGLMQGVPKSGQIVLESTPNGAQGWFYERCMEALAGNSDWTLHFYPWWWDDDYALPLEPGEAIEYTDDEAELAAKHELTPEQIKWRRSKQRELKTLFIQEYPEDPKSCFLLSGAGYFGDLTGVFTAPLNPVYQPDHRYYAGLDFAQTQDFTVCSVIDRTTRQQVDLLRINRLSWSEMRRQVREVCQRWHVHTLWAEKNSMGSTNTEELYKEFTAAGLNTAILEFTTSNLTKAQIMSDLHEALHEGGLKLQNIAHDDVYEQQREMMAFQSKQTLTGLWQLAAPSGEHDDIVIANALAWHGISGYGTINIDTAPDFLSNWRG